MNIDTKAIMHNMIMNLPRETTPLTEVAAALLGIALYIGFRYIIEPYLLYNKEELIRGSAPLWD